jgi:hypothetical protein
VKCREIHTLLPYLGGRGNTEELFCNEEKKSIFSITILPSKIFPIQKAIGIEKVSSKISFCKEVGSVF